MTTRPSLRCSLTLLAWLVAGLVFLTNPHPTYAADALQKTDRPTQTDVSEEPLFLAKPFTEAGEFMPGIEGPACDRVGNIYAVNFKQQHTIGRTTPGGKSELYLELPNGSTGNGIRIDARGTMFIADYTNHNVLQVDLQTRKIEILAHHDKMNQPNDLAMAADGTLYASDPNWKEGTGQLWRIERNGKVTQIASNLGTTNGIEVSPDGKTLYVSETVQRKIWAFPLSPKGQLGKRRLFKAYQNHGLDGMRCDVQGNLYVTRHSAGLVVQLAPDGKTLREIDVLGSKPSNLCFGGPDGRTVYVTEVEHRRLVQFRVEHPGLSWKRLHASVTK